jgi:hypothetical protein
VIQSNQVAHLRQFADTLATLQTLAEKELAQQCFSADEELFIRNLIQITGEFGCEGPPRYDGWYPRLFYNGVQFSVSRPPDPQFLNPESAHVYFQENFGVNAVDQIVADVHTDLPCEFCGDPGSVLHESIGRVNLLLIAVENGADRNAAATIPDRCGVHPRGRPRPSALDQRLSRAAMRLWNLPKPNYEN